MKKVRERKLRAEYSRKELGPGIRGKYHRGYAEGTNLVLLSPDVAAAFPNDTAVNDALRASRELAEQKMTAVTGGLRIPGM